MQKITILALHLDYGGIEKYISYLCKMFENKYDIEIICTYKFQPKPAFEFSNKIKIRYLIENDLKDLSIKELLKKKEFLKIIKEVSIEDTSFTFYHITNLKIHYIEYI